MIILLSPNISTFAYSKGPTCDLPFKKSSLSFPLRFNALQTVVSTRLHVVSSHSLKPSIALIKLLQGVISHRSWSSSSSHTLQS